MKIENLDDLAECFNRFANFKAQFKKANLLDEFEQALELHEFLKEVALKASKITQPPKDESVNADSKPKREYDCSKRTETEHKRRLEKLASLEPKEQAGILTPQEKRKLKNIRKAEKTYADLIAQNSSQEP
ncbi:hypothetical protein [Helicobacter bizzozeronii]|uniref:hypothetical protein n=1 Tax=Helicobacter bizzozeronii TaxID=56877 RepID=UPI000CEDD30C|nr:hypothetical protein [Helicobacter bizzozeronii]